MIAIVSINTMKIINKYCSSNRFRLISVDRTLISCLQNFILHYKWNSNFCELFRSIKFQVIFTTQLLLSTPFWPLFPFLVLDSFALSLLSISYSKFLLVVAHFRWTFMYRFSSTSGFTNRYVLPLCKLTIDRDLLFSSVTITARYH